MSYRNSYELPDHPEIAMAMRTGYPSWNQDTEEETRCCECGNVIPEDEDTYECRTHRVLCLDCLKMLHKRYV